MTYGIPWSGGGGAGWPGQGVPHKRGAPERRHKVEPWERTCPVYFLRSPFVQSILSLLPDFEANRLGPIWDLPASLVEYLRLAHDERESWKNFWEAEFMPQPKGK